jgi:dTDP-4-amino-4,6-dideoxygalactose transaminase
LVTRDPDPGPGGLAARIHRQRAYRTVGPSNGALPVTDTATAKVLPLPLWTGMDDELVDRVELAVAGRAARG